MKQNLIMLFTRVLFLVIALSAQGQWHQTNGPVGSSIVSMAFDGDVVYAGSFYGGVFRSPDGGYTWQSISGGMGNLTVTSLAVHNDRVYAGTDAGWGGLFISANSGASWQLVGASWINAMVTCLAVKDEYLVVGTYGGGIKCSWDNGETWFASTQGIVPWQSYVVSSLLATSGQIYSVVNGKLYRSDDNAASWNQITLPVSAGYVHQICSFGNGVVLAGNGGMFASFDNGQVWTSLAQNITADMVYGFTIATVNNAIYVMGVNGEGIHYSGNLGFTWSQLPNASETLVTGIFLKSEGQLFVQTSVVDSGYTSPDTSRLYRTTSNGQFWEDITQGIIDPWVLSLVSKDNYLWAGTYNTGIYRTYNQGSTYTNQGLRFSYLSELAVFGNTILAAGDGVWRSQDNGESWQASSSGLPTTSCSGFAKLGSDLFVATTMGVCISTNDGLSWSLVNNGLQTETPLSICSFGNKLFVGTYSGIYITNNFGNSWTPVYLLPNSTVGFESIVTNGIALFASTGNGEVYRSDDEGENWQQVSTGLALTHKLFLHGDKLFAYGPAGVVGFSGVKVSHDYGETWQDANEGLNNNLIFDLATDGAWLYAATKGSGVYKRTLSDFDVQQIPSLSHQIFEFFPNPASTECRIRASNTSLGANLEVLEICGKKVAAKTILSTDQVIDISNLSCGVYLLRLGNCTRTLMVQR